MHTKKSPYASLWLNWLVCFDNLLIAVTMTKLYILTHLFILAEPFLNMILIMFQKILSRSSQRVYLCSYLTGYGTDKKFERIHSGNWQ
jgi:hypothetical protein